MSQISQAIEKFLATGDLTGWSNIPARHSPIDAITRRKITCLQQEICSVKDFGDALERLLSINPDSPLVSSLKIAIEAKKCHISQLEQELEQYASEHGELYVMISGDYGGGSSKLLIQNLCSTNPHSLDNCFLLGFVEAPETYSTLKAAFGHFQVIIFVKHLFPLLSFFLSFFLFCWFLFILIYFLFVSTERN